MVRPIFHSVRLWVGAVLALLAIAFSSAWMWTRHRNAWNTAGAPWPRYVAIHLGQVAVFSTLWRSDRSGTHAWQSTNWIYDSLGGPTSNWIISYRRVGDSYDGTPPYKTIMHALFIPLWYPAVPLAIGSWVLIRRAWRQAAIGQCSRCGYSLDGLPGGAPCPECGGRTGPNSPRSRTLRSRSS